MLLLLYSCALQDSQVSEAYDASRASRLFSTGYQDVVDIYIDDLTVSELAVAGLDGLSSIDPKVAVEHRPGRVTLRVDGLPLRQFDTPSTQDMDAWGKLTAAVIDDLRGGSFSLGRAGAEDVYQAVFEGMISELDDYSRYAGREQARENRANRDGFGGIGVQIRLVDEGVKILHVMEDSPAEAGGLKANDVITHIEGQPAAGLTQSDVVYRLRGPVRSDVSVTVARAAGKVSLQVTLTRAHIVPQTVRYRAEGKIGYLRLTGFNQNTAQTLRQKLLQAKRELGKELKGFVLDLRGNPGGLLDQAVSVSDLFMTRGRIVSTHGRHPDSHQFFEAKTDDLAAGLPVVVLVNGNSASASEIVAAALQDSGRGVVIGTSSFGKGTVQTVLRLPNEGELTLTWAKFHAPSGYTLQRRGVMPDVCTSRDASNADQLLARVRKGGAVVDAAGRNWKAAAGDEKRIAAYRALCPVRDDDREIDLEVALALIEDARLYATLLRGTHETAERAP